MSKMNLKNLKNRAKYIVIFCVKEANTYNAISAKVIKPSITSIRYDKEHVFDVDVESPTYRKGNTQFFWIDVNSAQIQFARPAGRQY